MHDVRHIFFRNMTSKYYLKELDQDKHAELICRAYVYLHELYDTLEEAIMVVKYYIQSGPSIGAFTRSGNELVGWVITNLDRAAHMTHTHPDHRGSNLSNYVMNKLIEMKLNTDGMGIAYVAKNNVSSIKAIRKSGTNVIYTNQEFVHCTLRPNLANL